MTAPRAAQAVIIILAAALMLAGCGRKGPLDVPPPRGTTQTDEEEKQQEPKGDRKFILDPLIE